MKSGDRYLISSRALEKTIDPVLRPHVIFSDPNYDEPNLYRRVVLGVMSSGDDKSNALSKEIAGALERTFERRSFNVILSPNSNSAEDYLKSINEQRSAFGLVIKVVAAEPVERGVRTSVAMPTEGEPKIGARSGRNDGRIMALGAAIHSGLTLWIDCPDLGLALSREKLLIESRHPLVFVELRVSSGESEDQSELVRTFAESCLDSVLKVRPFIANPTLASRLLSSPSRAALAERAWREGVLPSKPAKR